MKSKNIFAATVSVAMFSWCLSLHAQEQTKKLEMDALSKPAATWFDPKACKSPPGGEFYISIGQTALKVDLASVNGAVPGKIRSMTQGPSGVMTMEVPRSIGCRESPLSVSDITLRSVAAVEAGAIRLSQTPEGANTLDAQLAKLRDTNVCPAAFPGLVICQGQRAVGDNREPVAYLLATDASLLQKSGGPLRARCLFRDNKPFCNVLDDVEGGVRYELPIAGKPDIDAISQAHAKARAYIEGARAKSK